MNSRETFGRVRFCIVFLVTVRVVEGVRPSASFEGGKKPEVITNLGLENEGRRLLDSSGIALADEERFKCGSDLYKNDTAVAYNLSGNWTWKPSPDKFLMLHCAYGRISNRIMCFRNAVSIAGLLNRTLLVIMDSSEIARHFDRHVAFDIDHVRSCYGENTVMSTDEYRERYGQVEIDQIICWNEKGCPVKDFTEPVENYFREWKSIRFAAGMKAELPEMHAWGRSIDQLTQVFGNATGRILYIGEFYFNTVRDRRIKPGDVPLKRGKKCSSRLAVQPDGSLFEAAKIYVKETFRSEPFMSVHLRRDDFQRFCGKEPGGCYWPISQVIFCLQQKLESFGLKNLFLATNTNAQELGQLKRELESVGVQIAQLDLREGETPHWMNPILKANLTADGLVRAELDKIICMHGTVFAGTRKSTFTSDIERLRYGFGTGDCRDSFLCENVSPRD